MKMKIKIVFGVLNADKIIWQMEFSFRKAESLRFFYVFSLKGFIFNLYELLAKEISFESEYWKNFVKKGKQSDKFTYEFLALKLFFSSNFQILTKKFLFL